MTAYKYFIKGTDFELPEWKPSVLDPEMGVYKVDVYRPLIPVSWVEKREVAREEPDFMGAIEKDQVGRLWMRNWSRQWISANTWFDRNGEVKSKMINWDELQKKYGPTKPMKVVPVEIDEDE